MSKQSIGLALTEMTAEGDRLKAERDCLQEDSDVLVAERDHWKEVCKELADVLEDAQSVLKEQHEADFALFTDEDGLAENSEHAEAMGKSAMLLANIRAALAKHRPPS